MTDKKKTDEIRFTEVRDITPASLDGKKYRYKVEAPEGSAEMVATCSGSFLATLDDDESSHQEFVQAAFRGIINNQREFAGAVLGGDFTFSTFGVGEASHADPTGRVDVPTFIPTPLETIVPEPQHEQEHVDPKRGTTLLETDRVSGSYVEICELRASLNRKFEDSYDCSLFRLHDETRLVTMFLRPSSHSEFVERLNCLNEINSWIDIGVVPKIEGKGSYRKLEFLLANVCGLHKDDAASVYMTLEAIREVRHGKIHRMNPEAKWAYEFLNLQWPIPSSDDPAVVYDSVFRKYAQALRTIDKAFDRLPKKG